MDEILFLYVTAPDDDTACRIAEALVDAHAAACVNILPRIRSIYRWNGAVERSEETGMIVKTTAAKAANARALIEQLHPYDTPVIAALPIDDGASGDQFVDWIKKAVSETLS